MQLNVVVLSGNLVRDPEVKRLPSGLEVAEFTVAHNESYAGGGGERREKVSYVRCCAFGKVAENVGKYCVKGMGVVVEGGLEEERWEKDGQKRSQMKVRAGRVHFMPRGEQKGEGGARAGAGAEPRPAAQKTERPAERPAEGEDDLPF